MLNHVIPSCDTPALLCPDGWQWLKVFRFQELPLPRGAYGPKPARTVGITMFVPKLDFKVAFKRVFSKEGL